MMSFSAIVPDGCEYDQCCTHQTANDGADDGASSEKRFAICYLLTALVVRMRFAIATGCTRVITEP